MTFPNVPAVLWDDHHVNGFLFGIVGVNWMFTPTRSMWRSAVPNASLRAQISDSNCNDKKTTYLKRRNGKSCPTNV